jgi:hypothetical protein
MAGKPGSARPIRTYTRRRLTVLSYARGIKGNNNLWRAIWYILLVFRAVQKLRPQERTVAVERLQPGEAITITATRELVRPRRKDRR